MNKNRKIDVVGHALGINVYASLKQLRPRREKIYRNYFTADEGDSDWLVLEELVADGYMVKSSFPRGCGFCFTVTSSGLEWFIREFKKMKPYHSINTKKFDAPNKKN